MQGDSGLRKTGLKTTVPRLKILTALENSPVRHLSAEDVYRQLLDANEEVGLATVYRVLTQFEQAGLVVRHNFDGGRSVYELNDEGPHEHLICTGCGAVVEFEDPELSKRLRAVAEKSGFALERHALYLYGSCQRGDCPNAGGAAPGA